MYHGQGTVRTPVTSRICFGDGGAGGRVRIHGQEMGIETFEF